MSVAALRVLDFFVSQPSHLRIAASELAMPISVVILRCVLLDGSIALLQSLLSTYAFTHSRVRATKQREYRRQIATTDLAMARL